MFKGPVSRTGPVSLVALAFALFVPSITRAQVIFEPVRYQYDGNPGFYYGGTDSRVFAFADRTSRPDGVAGPVEARYAVGTSYRGSLGRPPRVFSDRAPYTDAALLGYTASDARNDANAAVPTYYRKADLLASAVPARDGRTLVVPAQAPGTAARLIDIRPYRRPPDPATRPAEEPRPLLIIPRDLLRPPTAPPSPVVPALAPAKQAARGTSPGPT